MGDEGEFKETAQPKRLPFHKTVEIMRQDSLKSNANSIGKISVDFETAINQAGYGKFNYFMLLIAFPATCTSSFDTAALSFIMPMAVLELNLSPIEVGFLNSACYAGMICSSLLWGCLSDMLGRQKLLACGYFLDACAVTISGFAGSFWSLATFRFLSGFMICGPYSIFMAYLSEVFNSQHRDLAVLTAGVYYSIGSILQPGLAMVIVPLEFSWDLPFGFKFNSWRLFLVLCGIPSLICGVASTFYVESPKFLMNQGRKEEALKVFRKIYTINTGHPPNTYPVKKLHEETSGSSMARKELLKTKSWGGRFMKDVFMTAVDLFKKPHRTNSFFSFGLEFGLLSTLNVVRLWMPQLFAAVENSVPQTNLTLCDILISDAPQNQGTIGSEVFLNLMIIYAACLAVNCSTNVLVRFINKRTILVSTLGVSAASIILIPLVPTVFILPLAATFISLLNSYFYLLIAVIVELFPTSLRATSVSLTLMFGRVGIFIANLGLTKLLYVDCSLVFYILGSVLIVMIAATIFLPKPHPEENVEEFYPKKKNIV